MITISEIGLASRILSAVSLASSKDETRPSLNSVLLRVRDNVLHVVATNGHVLAHYHGALVESSPDADVLVPLDVVLKIAKASKKAHTVTIDPETCTARIEPDATQFTWRKLDGVTFPPYEQVIPPVGVPVDPKLTGFAISTDYLAFAGKIFATLATDKRATGVFIELPGKELDPIVLSSSSVSNLVVVVMPMRESIGPDRLPRVTKKAA